MPIDCDMRKWPDKPHWRFPMERIDEDDFGVWLGNLAPTPYTGPRGEGAWEHDFVLCVPRDEWWIATFNAYTTDLGAQIYVDMTTPPEWPSENHLQAIDLDLDVVKLWDGTIYIDDEDEFAEHQVKFGYPQDVIVATRLCADTILDRVKRADEPFGEIGSRWLRDNGGNA